MVDHSRLPAQIQGLLYAEGGALSFASLCKTLSCTPQELDIGLQKLSQNLEGSGLALVRSDTEATLAVSDAARDVVLEKATQETNRDVGDAGMEVLAILLYAGPSTRADIDYIRGVNSSSTIRNLLARGLIERAGNPADAREYIYRPTTELLAYLGARERTDLPEYGTISRELAAFNATQPSNHESGTNPGGARSSA